jgi:hypothetical protein
MLVRARPAVDLRRGASPATSPDGRTLYYQRSTNNSDFQLATSTREADDFTGATVATIPGETGAGSGDPGRRQDVRDVGVERHDVRHLDLL